MIVPKVLNCRQGTRDEKDMKMKKQIFAVALAVLSLGAFAENIPFVRYTAEKPFDGKGKCIEKVWKSADVCTRFLEVLKNEVAIDQTEARLLFDDVNLYVTLNGKFDPAFDRGKSGSSESNNFEVFIRPDGESSFLQVIAEEFGKLSVYRSGSEVERHDISLSVERGKGFWVANITIPFSVIGIDAPKEDLKAKIGLFRCNINVHERQKLYRVRRCASSFAAMERYRYSVPDTWADMVLTRKSAPARRLSGPEHGLRVNLFANSEFDIPGRSWGVSGNTTYQETMAMSGEWIYHAEGNGYMVLQASSVWMKPSTKYTLVVKARSFGEGSALRIITVVKDKNGKRRLSVWASGKQVPVGPDMHEYYIPFTSSSDEQHCIYFYKVDSRKEGTGIDFASIKLFEGEISSFEIRQITRPGRMATISGTEIPVKPSEYGRYPKELRALVLTKSKYLMREPEEIFAGTGAKIDVLLSEGKNQDIYLTDVVDGQKVIGERLKQGKYDLYMIPATGATHVGEKLAAIIIENVKKGAGLYLEKDDDLLHFKIVGKGGSLGKGRVYHASLAGKYHAYLPHAPIERCGQDLLPYSRFFDPKVAAEAYRTAFGEYDGVIAQERVEEMVYAGKKHRVKKGLDANGNTVKWAYESEPMDGAKLGEFKDDEKNALLTVVGDIEAVKLRWELSDFSKRIFAKGEIPAARLVSIPLERSKLYTNYGGLKLELVKDGRVIDCRGECIFVKDNDRVRLFDDFTPSMWPPTSTIGSLPTINSR